MRGVAGEGQLRQDPPAPAQPGWGPRHANCALWTIVRTPMVSHEPTRRYVERRTAEGLSKSDIMRCLKRYVARELYPLIVAIAGSESSTGELRIAA